MLNLMEPFCLEIVKGHSRVDGEANEEDVRLWVTQWPQFVIVLLSGCWWKRREVRGSARGERGLGGGSMDLGRGEPRLTRVPKTQADLLAVHHNAGAVIVKYSRHICAREPFLVIAHEHAGLADGAIAHDYTLYADFGHAALFLFVLLTPCTDSIITSSRNLSSSKQLRLRLVW